MSTSEQRIAALEAQVAQLTAQLASPSGQAASSQGAGPQIAASQAAAQQPAPAEAAHSAYDRRALLRRGGLAALAGAAAIPLVGTPAAAAAGDPLVIGTENSAAGTETGLTATVPDEATLRLRNTAQTTETTDAGPITYGHPSLQLTPMDALDTDPRSTEVGDLAATSDGLLMFGAQAGTSGAPAYAVPVFTGSFASYPEFIAPRRVLDTRYPTSTTVNDARDNIVNPGTALDTSGRLKAGGTILLDLSTYVTGGAGILGYLTVVGPTANGFLTVYPEDVPKPNTSNVIYTKGQVFAGFVVSGLGGQDAVRIYSSVATHVLLEIVAFQVRDPFSLNTAILSGAAKAAASGRAPAHRQR